MSLNGISSALFSPDKWDSGLFSPLIQLKTLASLLKDMEDQLYVHQKKRISHQPPSVCSIEQVLASGRELEINKLAEKTAAFTV